MNVILYTTPSCGICRMVKIKLQQKEINYVEKDAENIADKLDVQSAPILQIDNIFLTTPTDIVSWINNQ